MSEAAPANPQTLVLVGDAVCSDGEDSELVGLESVCPEAKLAPQDTQKLMPDLISAPQLRQ